MFPGFELFAAAFSSTVMDKNLVISGKQYILSVLLFAVAVSQ